MNEILPSEQLPFGEINIPPDTGFFLIDERRFYNPDYVEKPDATTAIDTPYVIGNEIILDPDIINGIYDNLTAGKAQAQNVIIDGKPVPIYGIETDPNNPNKARFTFTPDSILPIDTAIVAGVIRWSVRDAKLAPTDAVENIRLTRNFIDITPYVISGISIRLQRKDLNSIKPENIPTSLNGVLMMIENNWEWIVNIAPNRPIKVSEWMYDPVVKSDNDALINSLESLNGTEDLKYIKLEDGTRIFHIPYKPKTQVIYDDETPFYFAQILKIEEMGEMGYILANDIGFPVPQEIQKIRNQHEAARMKQIIKKRIKK